MSVDLLIDGGPATAEDLTYLALVNYGAYTSFAVERGAARGLDLHLERLAASAVELFGEVVDPNHLRDLMRQAVAGRDACWLRVGLFSPDVWPRTPTWRGAPRVMTTVSAPAPPLASSLRLQTQAYAREAAHLKHTATFGLIRARRSAREARFDDALFVGADGLISEGSLWNIGFVSGDRVTWPQAPMLAGVAQALVDAGLEGVGLTGVTAPARIDDLDRFDFAFICNSATPACAVASIDARAFEASPDLITRLRAAWEQNPLQLV